MITKEKWERTQKKPYNDRGMKETCLNCGKKTCALAGRGNIAGINENDGCWIPEKGGKE